MVDYGLFEIVISTFAFLMFVVIALEVVLGLGRPFLWLLFLIVWTSALAIAVVVALVWDIPAAIVKAIRKQDGSFKVLAATTRFFTRITDAIGPRQPREISLDEIAELNQLLALSPTGFEVAVGDLLRARGYTNVRRIGGAGDLAVDLTARSPKGRSVAVQCKRYRPGLKIGSPEIQKFIGMTTTHHRVAEAIFVTTSGFTKPASELASKHKIELIDGARLSEMLLELRPEALTEDDPLIAEFEGQPVTAVSLRGEPGNLGSRLRDPLG